MSEATLTIAAAALDHWNANPCNMPAREFVKRITAHIMDEVRAMECDCGCDSAHDAPPAAERMSERDFDASVAWLKQNEGHNYPGSQLEEIVDEAARARKLEAELIRNYADQSAYVGKANERIAALEFGRDGLVSERNGLKVAHKVLDDAIDYMNDLIDRKDNRIAELESKLHGCGVHIERISREGIADADKAQKRIAELERQAESSKRGIEGLLHERGCLKTAWGVLDTATDYMNDLIDRKDKRIAELERDAKNWQSLHDTNERCISNMARDIPTARGLLERATPTECHCDLEVNYKCEWCCRVEAFLAVKESEHD